jgi:hypothetical protein
VNKDKRTLDSLNADVRFNEFALKHCEPADVEANKEALRKAKEAVRVFSYRAKPCLSRNGKALRP